ncbi:nucleotide sugar dehydrogenase [Enterococcus saccharolyticus]|uniref:nucleotide sugar dehydrogenase n=1 Tax=Enterococcus saccharolyticus TaxID=41997 RepID=UPI0039DF43B3
MGLYEEIKGKKAKISIIGLGYVGMPIAVAFAKKVNVIGFDINKDKIGLYKKGIDPTMEVGDESIKNSNVEFTSNPEDLKQSKFHIVAVPTPIRVDKTPDLAPVEEASKIVGKNLTKGSYVVFESTVYPGVTEDICIPILEQESGLICGKDFKVGYSPERINPGDKVHKLETIIKIVSGMDAESLDEIAKVYEIVIEAGIYKAESIKVAEAAKVAENSQRDINIAFMNELAMVFDKMNIDTHSVVNAMNTKWNSLGFYPGLVGGHCIGVDPYYFIYEAEKLGYHSQIILSGRKINDGIPEFVVENVIKKMIKAGINIAKSKIGILGITFKENCPDIRNSKVEGIIKGLKEYNIDPLICDPYADKEEVKEFYDVDLVDKTELNNLDALILAVSHEEYRNLSILEVDKLFKNVSNDKKVIIDIKNVFDINELKSLNYTYWRL